MSAANLRMNNKRNQYHLICRVISICLCALFCLSFGCTSKKEERLQEIIQTATIIIEMISRTVLIPEMTIKTVPTLIEMTEMML